MRRKPKVLIVCSANPFKGPGRIALNKWKSFREHGYECDLLTLYSIPEHPEILSVYDDPKRNILHSVFWRIKFIFLRRCGKIWPQRVPYAFFYKEEECPPIPISDVLKTINKNYDWVKIVFHQNMMSFKTIEAIYDKLHCLVTFAGVDYAHMSGGCHFFGTCTNYMNECGMCPAWGSSDPHDFTHNNLIYRREVYKKLKPLVYGNSYMIEKYSHSSLLRSYDRIEKSYATLDEDLFYPRENIDVLRQKFGIRDNVQFIIFFGCQNINDPRKGFAYFKEALNIFYNSISVEQRQSCLLLTTGNLEPGLLDDIPMQTVNIGYVNIDTLCEAYSVSNLYVCSSIDDAGPSMVWQCLMCGVPVVGFEMGACVDAVKEKGTGYCATLKDSGDLACGVKYIYDLSQTNPIEYYRLKKHCSDFAFSICSKEVRFQSMLEEHYKYWPLNE